VCLLYLVESAQYTRFPPLRIITRMSPPPKTVDETLALLGRGGYVADRSLATAVTLALKLNRPLFLEGEAGVGKTEIAKVLAETLGRRLIRLQCYEGLDVASAVYEWNYAAQMIAIRLAEAAGVREAAIYRYFAGKEEMSRAALQILPPNDDGDEFLEALVLPFEHLRDRNGLSSLFCHGSGGDHPRPIPGAMNVFGQQRRHRLGSTVASHVFDGTGRRLMCRFRDRRRRSIPNLRGVSVRAGHEVHSWHVLSAQILSG
jgi:hypothetical protein